MSQLWGFSGDQGLVADLLLRSVSSNERERTEAYARILELEATPTFLATLIDVAYLGDASVSKLAFICAKNTLTRARGATVTRVARGPTDDIAETSVQNLKTKLYSVLQVHLNSDNRLLSKDFVLLVRKVCRWNYPQSWMSMHELLVAMLEASTSDSTVPARTLNSVMLMYHIFKEKCSMRLMKDRNVTVQLAQVLYPPVSKRWLQNWIGHWDSGKIDTHTTILTLNSVDMDFSRYLDSLLIALYTHGPRDIYQNAEMLELLRLFCAKLRLHLSLVQNCQVHNELLCKNCRRLLRCASQLFEYEAMVFAFVDPALILDAVFDFLAAGESVDIISECLTLLSNAFKSPVVHNDRYTQQYLTLHADGPAAIGFNETIADDFVLCSTFEEMKSQFEMTASCANGISVQSLKKSSSPTKGPYYAIGSMAEYMSRQATFLFCASLGARGGLLKLVDFLRDRYLTLSLDTIEEWNEDVLPMEPPRQSQACVLIDAMKVTGIPLLHSIVSGIAGTDCRADFLRFDSYLALYAITYTSIANSHLSKHYLMTLDALKTALTAVDPIFAKLLIFRCSRIVDAWIKRINFFEEQVKRDILLYLLYCICCEGDSMSALNLRVQHLVPFHRIYNKTIDQPFWDVLRQGNDVMRVVSSVLMISKIQIPVIQHRSLELVCKMCLEFDNEDNNFGAQLSDILTVFSDSCNDLHITASLLQTSLSFLNSLDWQRCYAEDFYMNSHLRRFLFQLLFRIIVICDGPATTDTSSAACMQGGQRMVSANRHQELEEDTYTLWVCLLRVLPHNIDVIDIELRENIFRLFPLLLRYLTEYDNRDHPGQMRVCLAPVLALDVVTEYMTVLLDHYRAQLPGGTTSSGKADIACSNVCPESGKIWFKLTDNTKECVEFSIYEVQSLCIHCLKREYGDTLRHAGLRLLNILMFGFGSACIANKEMLLSLYELFLFFCGKLNEGGLSPGEAPHVAPGSRLSCMSNGSRADVNTQWKYSKLHVEIVDSVASIVPILCRWGFDSPGSFSEALIRALESGKFNYPEMLLLSLVHASYQLNSNAYLRFGAIICSCLLTSVMASKYSHLKLFVQFQDATVRGMNREESDGRIDNPHVSISGIYLPCYMLRSVDSIVSLYIESKRASCFSITKAPLHKDIGGYVLPSSKRFHLFANASATYQSTVLPMFQLPSQELFFGALKSTVQCITQLSQALSARGIPGSMTFLLQEASQVNTKISEIINACHSGNV